MKSEIHTIHQTTLKTTQVAFSGMPSQFTNKIHITSFVMSLHLHWHFYSVLQLFYFFGLSDSWFSEIIYAWLSPHTCHNYKCWNQPDILVYCLPQSLCGRLRDSYSTKHKKTMPMYFGVWENPTGISVWYLIIICMFCGSYLVA